MFTSSAPIGRIGAIGDVHCEDRLLEIAIEGLERLGVDRVVCVGDIVDGMGDADRCIALLRDRGVATVAGNHERWLLEGTRPKTVKHVTEEVSDSSRSWLSELPRTLRWETPAGGLMICHGVGSDDMSMLKTDTRGYALQDIDTLRELMLDTTLSYMLGGHTHERMIRRFQGVTVINCGTIRRGDDTSVSVLDFDAMRVEHHALGPTGLDLLEELDLPAPSPLPASAHG